MSATIADIRKLTQNGEKTSEAACAAMEEAQTPWARASGPLGRFRSGDKAPASRGEVTATEPARSSYETFVSAQSRPVAGRGRDIARAVKALTR